jgi:hypothetical protein
VKTVGFAEDSRISGRVPLVQCSSPPRLITNLEVLNYGVLMCGDSSIARFPQIQALSLLQPTSTQTVGAFNKANKMSDKQKKSAMSKPATQREVAAIR